jgi:hypothetical protein
VRSGNQAWRSHPGVSITHRTDPHALDRSRDRSPHLAVGVVNGVDAWAEPQMSVWWPWLAAALALGQAGLTALQVCLSLGHYSGAILGTRLAQRFGSRFTLAAGTVAVYGGYPLAVIAPSPLWAGLSLIAAGIGNGVYNVAQFTTNSAVESGGKRHNLLYSGLNTLLAFGGAVAAGGALAIGLSPRTHLVIMLALATCVVALVVTRGGLPDIRPPHDGTRRAPRPPGFLRAVAPLALVAALAAIPAGVVFSRGTALLVSLDAPRAVLGALLVVYMATTTAVRLALWAAGARMTPAAAARLSAPLAVVGGLVLCASPAYGGWPLATLGFALVGAGTASVTPLCVSLAGERMADSRVRAVGFVLAFHFFAIACTPAVVLLLSLAIGSVAAAVTLVLACVVGLLLSPLTFRTHKGTA